MILAYGYIKRERIKYFEIAIIAALGAGVYYFCDARVNTVCILVTAGILFYNKFRIEQAVKRRKNYEMNPDLVSATMHYTYYIMCYIYDCNDTFVYI